MAVTAWNVEGGWIIRVDSTKVVATLEVDRQVNAATLSFEDTDIAGPLRDYPIEMDGSIGMIVTVTADGRLAQIELLDAKRQLPIALDD